MLLTACYYSKVLNADGTQKVGVISKQWSGLVKEYFTDANNFGIQCMIFSVCVFASMWPQVIPM